MLGVFKNLNSFSLEPGLYISVYLKYFMRGTYSYFFMKNYLLQFIIFFDDFLTSNSSILFIF